MHFKRRLEGPQVPTLGGHSVPPRACLHPLLPELSHCVVFYARVRRPGECFRSATARRAVPPAVTQRSLSWGWGAGRVADTRRGRVPGHRGGIFLPCLRLENLSVWLGTHGRLRAGGPPGGGGMLEVTGQRGTREGVADEGPWGHVRGQTFRNGADAAGEQRRPPRAGRRHGEVEGQRGSRAQVAGADTRLTHPEGARRVLRGLGPCGKRKEEPVPGVWAAEGTRGRL